MIKIIMEVDVTERMSIELCIMLTKALIVIPNMRHTASHHVLIVVVTRVVNYVTVRNKVKYRYVFHLNAHTC